MLGKNISNNDLKRVYNLIEGSRKKYGNLKKCEFHLHTPASHDYELIKDKNYSQLSIEEILEFSVEIGYLNKGNKDFILKEVEEYKSNKYVEALRESNKPYSSFKEYIAYMNIAHKLYQENIEVVFISDHNTVSGFHKLKYALNEYYVERIKITEGRRTNCIYLFLGVEISCSDQNHLVVIYDNNRINELEVYLDEIVLSQEYGSFLDSRSIIEDISKQGGLAYLAHLNSSKWLGSMAYKKKLYNMKELQLIGIKDLNQKSSVISKLGAYVSEAEDRFSFINEGDSHNIADIGINTSWIKFNKIDFTSLEKAIANRKICIYDKKPRKSNKFIKGIVSIPGDYGFLKNNHEKLMFSNKEEDIFSVYFSRDLNCIIGGRGTGKSTLLNMVEIIYSQETDNKKTLKFISQNKIIYSIFRLDDYDYILRFIPQVRNKEEYYYLEDTFILGSVKETEGKYCLSASWRELYKVDKDRFIKLNEVESNRILERIFRRGYNINKLVEKINLGQIGKFIRDTVTYGIDYDRVDEYIYEIKDIPNRSSPNT